MSFKAWARALLILLTATLLAGGPFAIAPANAGGSTITGIAFRDLDRDGIKDADEAPFAGHQLYLFRPDWTYVATVLTTADGSYSFSGLADGSYYVRLDTSAWNEIRYEWVPSSGDVWPTRLVELRGTAIHHFAWRPIVTSNDPARPITTARGASGLTINSYTDAVSAQEVLDALAIGPLGDESGSIEVRFGLGTGNCTNAAVTGDPTVGYSNYRAVSSVDYASWLDSRDAVLVHEFGHAWTQYYAFVAQRDPGMRGYLRARGLEGDPRVGSSYYWSPLEMIAEDYRQLFGSATAAAPDQDNRDIPPAAAISGLRDYLLGAFRTPSPASPAPAPAPAPAVDVTGLTVNPASVTTSARIEFTVNVAARTTVTITDKRGTLVRTLADNAPLGAGAHAYTWDRTDARGRKVRGGDYRVSVTAVDAASASDRETQVFKVS